MTVFETPGHTFSVIASDGLGKPTDVSVEDALQTPRQYHWPEGC